jgi:GntR family transcriptional repressor for pyruvate dehydrogenase complex
LRATHLTPISKPSFFQEVILRFEDLLRSGALKPGERLPSEPELALAFQVSRPTLREALKAMSLLGLLVSRNGDGTYVSDDHRSLFRNALYFSSVFTNVDFLGLIETRIAIEPFLAEQAATRATEADIERMQTCIDRMQAGVGNFEPYLAAEVTFHDEIARAARSPILQAILHSLRDLLLEGRKKITADQIGPDNLRLHTRIFEAIRKRSPALARRRMLEHLEDGRKRYQEFYRKFKIGSTERVSMLAARTGPLLQRQPPIRRGPRGDGTRNCLRHRL